VVEEEETECDKSVMEETIHSDMTHAMNEESHAEDESVVIKRPMSSKKSKSLENINKINLRGKLNDKALLEIYKQQFQILENHTSQYNQRNGGGTCETNQSK
jgi:hypothetical protein